jgi:hypothetical protein
MERSVARVVAHALAVSVAIPLIVLLAVALSTALVFACPTLASVGQSSSRSGFVAHRPYELTAALEEPEPADQARAAAQRPTGARSHPAGLAAIPVTTSGRIERPVDPSAQTTGEDD